MLRQFSVRLEDQRDGFLEVRTCFFQGGTLGVRTGEFLDKPDVSLGHLAKDGGELKVHDAMIRLDGTRGLTGDGPDAVGPLSRPSQALVIAGRWSDEVQNMNRTHVLPPAMRLPYTGRMSALDSITITPDVRFGKPCVRGTRITVGDILGYLAGGMSEDQILAEFPQLTREDIRACLAYAAERERRTLGVPAA